MKRQTFHAVVLIALLAAVLGACSKNAPPLKAAEESDVGPKVVEGGIKFTIYQTKAAKVTIAGDFNDWSATSDPLFDRDRTGVWTLVIPLSPGSYQYKFVIDGDKWISDPGNPKTAKDGFGGLNSVIEVGKVKAVEQK